MDVRNSDVYVQFLQRQTELESAISKTWAQDYAEAEAEFKTKMRHMLLPRFALHQAEVYISQALFYDSHSNFDSAQDIVQKAHSVCQRMMNIREPHVSL
jgi:hypothetical protein